MLDLKFTRPESGVAQATTNAYATLGSDIKKEGHYQTVIQVHNPGGANGLHFRILGSVDGGTNFDDTLLGETLVGPGAAHSHTITLTYYTDLRVQVKSAVPGAHTTALLRGCALRVR